MRKKNREVRLPEEIRGIVERCDVCRVALPTEGAPYIVPMNFGFEFSGGGGGDSDGSGGSIGSEDGAAAKDKLTLWFHCAVAGRKLDLIADGCEAGFEMDTDHELRPGETACAYSMNYASVIGSGHIAQVADNEERMHGLKAIMKHYGGDGLPFNEKDLSLTCVLRLDAAEYACKRLKK
jgi:nitroimidazol reductase NimA-like FMN-containing flavoprotein (pyridoxamine 5'-phosphate oxidase superfamily)